MLAAARGSEPMFEAFPKRVFGNLRGSLTCPVCKIRKWKALDGEIEPPFKP